MWTGRKRRQAQRHALAVREAVGQEGPACARDQVGLFGVIVRLHALNKARASAVKEENAQTDERKGGDGGDDTANYDSSRGVVRAVAKKRRM